MKLITKFIDGISEHQAKIVTEKLNLLEYSNNECDNLEFGKYCESFNMGKGCKKIKECELYIRIKEKYRIMQEKIKKLSVGVKSETERNTIQKNT